MELVFEFSHFYKKDYWDFDRDCTKSVDYLRKCYHVDNIKLSNPLTQYVFPLMYISLISSTVICRFPYAGVALLVKFIEYFTLWMLF